MSIITTDGVIRDGMLIVQPNYSLNLNKYKYNDLQDTIRILLNSYKNIMFTIIVDFKKVKMCNINIIKLKKLIQYTNEFYPDKLKFCFIYGLKKIFKPVVKVLMLLLDDDTKEKIIFRTKPLNDTVISV
jgi:hypothetical protein